MKDGLSKIISGGQTGVDLAALKAASALGFPVGGWCPPDGRNEQGPIPPEYHLTPSPEINSELAPEIPRSQRTEWNVRDSDGTLIITLKDHPLGKGSWWAREAARLLAKPCLMIALPNAKGRDMVDHWLLQHRIRILNIAGPSESEISGIEGMAFGFIKGFLEKITNNK